VGINYIKETEELIKLLSMHGKSDIANKLKDAMDGASTGTELIMGVKYHLEQVKGDDIPEILRPRVAKLVNGIKELLK
jgi:hypothetical protein